MFTGIISGLGRIVASEPLGSSFDHGLKVRVATPEGYLHGVALGDSIAVSGACMTVTSFSEREFSFDISSESLAKTTGLDQMGPVNLEQALRAGDRLGGHIVSGHVDGIGTVLHLKPVGDQWRELAVRTPRDLAPFLAYKGSIAINGVSLTVNTVEDHADHAVLTVRLIPHTLQETTLGQLVSGHGVNLEVDTVARYVHRMMASTLGREPI